MGNDDSKRHRVNVEVRESRIQGLGVFATRDFARDEVIMEIDDSNPVSDRSELRPDQANDIDVFVCLNGEEKVIFMKPPERYVNASCDPNSIVRTDMTSGARKAIALREIHEGEEITWDYAINSQEEWEIPVPCNCGSPSCRGIIRGNFFTLPRDVQSRYLSLLDTPFREKYKHEIESLNLAHPDS